MGQSFSKVGEACLYGNSYNPIDGEMDDKGDRRICEGEKWVLGTGDRQTVGDRCREAVDVQIPLQWLPLSL